MHVWRLFVVMALAGLVLLPGSVFAQEERCFPETGFCITGRFRQFWEQNGGLAVFGYPLGPARGEINRETGAAYLTQWFERNRFELHFATQPYDVQLGRLGDDELRRQGRDWQAQPRTEPQPGCQFFAETGHNVCGEILAYWRANGLNLDGRPGVNAAESLALFGLPLGEAQVETLEDGKQYSVQWFERARFEVHPELPAGQQVLLGLLGSSGFRQNTAQPGGVVILSYTRMDFFGPRLVGEVRNDTGGNVRFPCIGKGNSCSPTNLFLLKPGQRAGFDVYLDDGAVKPEDLQLTWTPTTEEPVTALTLINMQTLPDGDIVGEVRNDSDTPVKDINIDVRYYDALGIVVGYGQVATVAQETVDPPIQPGETRPFTAFLFRTQPSVRYEIDVQGVAVK